MEKFSWFCLMLFLVLSGWWIFTPEPEFSTDFSHALYSSDGQLMAARVAKDDQWRFAIEGSLSRKYVDALLEFEDRRFLYHFGIDPIGMIRALRDNLLAGRVVSGGSTITMQLARLGLGHRERTYTNKLIEILSALKLELLYSKDEIIRAYAQNAPFGGNLVGVQSASVRYLGRFGDRLSWADAALLAILPNRPGVLNLGSKREDLRARRDRFLDHLVAENYLDKEAGYLAKREPLPSTLFKVPKHGAHILNLASGPGGLTTIDVELQSKTHDVLARHAHRLARNHIFNSAMVIAEVETGHVLAYHGNVVSDGAEDEHAGYVDCAQAKRSTGSILKPFLFAKAIEDRQFFPRELLPDIPVRLGGFRPENFDRSYRGVVPADEALAQSLNVPAVHVLSQYGVERFHRDLVELGFDLLPDPWHYGLSIILGGAESSLWRIVGLYRAMAKRLRDGNGSDSVPVATQLRLFPVAESTFNETQEGTGPQISASSLWLTADALERVIRPDTHNWVEEDDPQRRFAWKTGTSYGFRDGWALGFDRDYVVGVWVGNADGSGRQYLTGRRAAAPIIFDLIELLPESEWFDPPASLKFVDVCAHSGQRAGPACDDVVQMTTQSEISADGRCRYCKAIRVDPRGGERVHSGCLRSGDAREVEVKHYFTLSPQEAFWYSQHHADFQEAPRWRPGCGQRVGTVSLEIVSPMANASIVIPEARSGGIVFEAVASRQDTVLHWFLNENYLGETRDYHQFTRTLEPGDYVVTVTDESAGRASHRFRVEAN